MKQFLLLLLVFASATFSVKAHMLFAESDTLVIKLKNGQQEKIACSDVNKIQFENTVSVYESITGKTNLLLKGNRPNPFSEQTSLEFEISSQGNVVIVIYDNSGSQIQTLKCENCQPGKNSLQWDCLDKTNTKVQSGMYFYEVHYNNEVQSKKMILIK